MGIWESILLAVSLCADCFACTLCSGVTLKKGGPRTIAAVALAFAVIQAGLLWFGWAFGNLFVGFVEKASHLIGFLLLLYVGGRMFLEGLRALRGQEADQPLRLDGLRNVVLSGVATSIDALAVGVSQSMGGEMQRFSAFLPLFAAVFVVTAFSVVAGLLGGRVLGRHFGHWAEVAGGCVLVGIGLGILL